MPEVVILLPVARSRGILTQGFQVSSHIALQTGGAMWKSEVIIENQGRQQPKPGRQVCIGMGA